MMVAEETVEALPKEFAKTVRDARMRFLDRLEPLRPELYRYCRSLAGEPWEAEDLVQETLLRAFSKMGEIHFALAHPRPWLFRIATNCWIDRTRRSEPSLLPDAFDAAAPDETPSTPEVQEALERLAASLPPQERAAVLLKDVFDFSLDEVAGALGTTRGAVKAALHRARGKLEAARREPPRFSPGRETAPRALVEEFVSAFNARDMARLTPLLLESASADVVGMVQEYGREQITQGSLGYTVHGEEGDARAEIARFRGETIALLWYLAPGGGEETRAVGDILRFTSDEGKIRELRYYYFSPELLVEIGRELGVAVRTNGHRYSPR